MPPMPYAQVRAGQAGSNLSPKILHPPTYPPPRYSRHRIVGVPFRGTIANSPHAHPRSSTTEGPHLHTTAPVRAPPALYGVTRCKSYCKGPYSPKCMKWN